MSGTDYSLPEGTTDTTSTGVTLTSGEDFEVQDGGTTYDTDIENGATEDVLGTTASAVSSFILSGGEEDVYDGATDTGSVVSSGGILSAFAADGANPPGDVVSTTVLSGGEVQVEGLSDAVSVGQGGLVETADAGLTSDTQVQSGGTELVYDDGSSDGTMVSTGGVQVALASLGTSGQVLTVSGSNGVVETASGGSGSFAISSGSVTDTFTSNANGSLSVVASNSVTGQYESGTATSGLLYSAYIAEFTGGTASNTTVQSGATILFGGGADPGLDVDYGGQIQIGGAFDVGVDAGGALATAILTGATASGVTVADGATLTVTSGNTADDTTIAPGGVEEVQYGAEDEVTGATTAPGTITIQSGARQDVQSGGVTFGVVLSGGVQYVHSGGTTSNTVVSSGGKQGVIAGGNAFGTTVLSGAAFYYEGGNVVGLTVSSGGSAVIEGPAPGVTVTEGGLTVDVGGTLYVLHDGIAVGTDLANGAMGPVGRHRDRHHRRFRHGHQRIFGRIEQRCHGKRYQPRRLQRRNGYRHVARRLLSGGDRVGRASDQHHGRLRCDPGGAVGRHRDRHKRGQRRHVRRLQRRNGGQCRNQQLRQRLGPRVGHGDHAAGSGHADGAQRRHGGQHDDLGPSQHDGHRYRPRNRHGDGDRQRRWYS